MQGVDYQVFPYSGLKYKFVIWVEINVTVNSTLSLDCHGPARVLVVIIIFLKVGVEIEPLEESFHCRRALVGWWC